MRYKQIVMKKFNSIALLETLEADTRQLILEAHRLLQTDPETLTLQPVPGKWSVAQNIEHLNTYSRYYIPVIRQALSKTTHTCNPEFRSGWLGNYFTKMMKPSATGQVGYKMKAMKNHMPPPDIDSKNVLDEFLDQQQQLLDLLQQARQFDIGRIRIPISISKMIGLKLGDTFRFFIAHEQRHFVQLQQALKMIRQEEQTLNSVKIQAIL